MQILKVRPQPSIPHLPIPLPRLLNLDNIRPPIRQLPNTRRPGTHTRKVKHPNMGKRQPHG